MTYTIYSIRRKSNPEQQYIGQTIYKNPYRRWWKHRGALRKNAHINCHLQRAWNKYGEDDFEFVIKEFAPDCDTLNSLEKIYVAWDGYYNIDDGGRRSYVTEETRRKISLAIKAKHAEGAYK